jgi:hypothetical protein
LGIELFALVLRHRRNVAADSAAGRLTALLGRGRSPYSTVDSL